MLLAVASGVVVRASGTALAGPPAWCKDASADEPRMSDMGSKDSADVLKAFVAAECHPNAEVEAHRADIEKARAAWSKRLGMAEEDWADAVAYVNLGNGNPKAELTTKKFLEMTPVDQWIAMGRADSDSQGGMDGFYVADIFDAKLSEVARLGLIDECIRSDSAIRWASCQDDIDKLDFTKLFEQVHADSNHSPELRQKIRMTAYGLPSRLKEHAEKVEKRKGEDPAWKKAFVFAVCSRGVWASFVVLFVLF